MNSAAPSSLAIRHAYRHLFRQALKAINYATPQRHVLKKTIRSSFRSLPAEEFSPRKIENTMRFLERATDVVGGEHKIVKNLMLVRFWEQPQMKKDGKV